MRSDPAFAAVFTALLLVAAWLAVGYHYLPLQDWPQHLAMASITSHWNDPARRFAEFYVPAPWFRPYHGFRLLQVFLGRLFGDELGFRLAAVVPLVGAPLALLGLVRRLGRDRWVVIATFTVLVEANLLWGYLPHVAAVALYLAALSATLDVLDGKRALAGLLLALGIAIFFTHPQVCALLLPSVTVLALVRRDAGRRRALAVAAVLPSGALLLSWALLGGVAAVSRKMPTEWPSPAERLLHLGRDSGLTLMGPWPALAFLLALMVLIVAAWRQGWRRDPGDVAPPLTALLVGMALLLPSWWHGEAVAGRYLSLAALALLLLPPLRPAVAPAGPRLARLWRPLLVLCALVSLGTAHLRFARYQRETSALDRLLPLIPMGSRVAVLAYGWPSTVELPDWVHLGGYVQAARGGLNALTTTQSAVDYAPTVPRMCRLEEHQFGPEAKGWQLSRERAGCYDYVLVTRGKRYPGAPAADGFEQIAGEGELELWRRR